LPLEIRMSLEHHMVLMVKVARYISKISRILRVGMFFSRHLQILLRSAIASFCRQLVMSR